MSGVLSCASAPGKAILVGEHAVVHGHAALAVALSDLRTVITVSETPEPVLSLSLPDLVDARGEPLNHDWPVAEVAQALEPVTEEVHSDLASGASPELLAALRALLGARSDDDARALMPLLFLCVRILRDALLRRETGIRVDAVSVSLPVGAGLGSSAAFSVAASAALLRAADRLSLGADPRAVHLFGQRYEAKRPTDSGLAVVNAWAYAAECIIHGNPSGLDNTISCFGGALTYVKNPRTITHLDNFPKLQMLITNTKVPRSTKELVAGVGRLRERHPGVVDHIFQAVEEITKSVVAAADAGGEPDYLDLGRLFSMNQRLLDAVGVGHPAINRVVYVTAEHGLRSKLTGAGGGGCVLTLVPPGTPQTAVASCERELTDAGFQCLESDIGGDGVLVHGQPPPPSHRVGLASRRMQEARAAAAERAAREDPSAAPAPAAAAAAATAPVVPAEGRQRSASVSQAAGLGVAAGAAAAAVLAMGVMAFSRGGRSS